MGRLTITTEEQMDDTYNTKSNESPFSGHKPDKHNSVGDTQSLESQSGRSVGQLSNRGGHADSAVSVPGNDRGAEASRGADKLSATAGPLAQMHKLIEKAGEEPFPDDTIRILSLPVDDNLVDIRPDGLIYVSHPHYRDRLDRAFGPGAWALIPLAVPRIQDNRVLYYGFLKARGQYIADAVGGSPYYANNPSGSYDNSVEGAKSDCLVRCCKALPMFRECWDREYAEAWKARNAVEVAQSGAKGGKVWKKKGAAMRNFDVRPSRAGESEYARPRRLIDEQQQHIESIQSEGGKHWRMGSDNADMPIEADEHPIPRRITSRDAHNENERGYNEWEDQ